MISVYATTFYAGGSHYRFQPLNCFHPGNTSDIKYVGFPHIDHLANSLDILAVLQFRSVLTLTPWARTQQFKGSIPQDYLPTADTNSKSWTNWLLTNQESNSLKFSPNSGKQLTCNCQFIMKPTTEEEPTEEMHRATYGGGVQGFLALFGPPSQHLSVFINL